MKRKQIGKAWAVPMAVALLLGGCQPITPPSSTPVMDVQLTNQEPEPSATPEDPAPSQTPQDSAPPSTPTPLPQPPAANIGEVGYIDIPKTKVKYPLVLYSDNEFYLTNDASGKRNYKGAIFMDYRNADPEQRRNVVIYGHNMKDQTMFSTIHYFERKKFFEENSDLYFEMFGVKYRYEIVYTGVFDYRDYNHIYTVFASEQEFLDYYKEGAKYAQYVREDYTPFPGDQMLTLSTCVSHGVKDFNYKRMILVARMAEVMGIGEHTTPPPEYGPAEAQMVLEELPTTRTAAMQDHSDEIELQEEILLIAPPGES